jgi:hypothetical protein
MEDVAIEISSEEIVVEVSSDEIVDKGRCNYFTGCFHCERDQLRRNHAFCFNRKWLKPTVRRIVFLIFGLLLYGGAAVLFWLYGPYVFRQFTSTLEFFILLNATETVMNLLALIFSTPPNVDPTPDAMLRQLGVIIPVHGEKKDIKETIASLIAVGIDYAQIFIIENTGNRYAQHASATFQLLTSSDEYQRINYYYISEWGSKVAAEFIGAFCAHELGLLYGMMIDDDVLVPPTFDPYLLLLDKHFKMIAYPIAPSNRVMNYLTFMQKREYRRSDRNNYFKYILGSVLAPHGAVSTVDLITYLENMRKRPIDGAFFAEDQKKGAAWRWARHKIAMAPGNPVGTETPDDCALLWGQRVGSWETGAHMSCFMYFEDFVTYCPTRCTLSTFLQFTFLKIYQIQPLMTILSDVVRAIILVSFITDWYFWAVIGFTWEANNLIDMLDEVFFHPHHLGKKVFKWRSVLASFRDHHLSFVYVLMSTVNGITSGVCAWIGAGAAAAEDFGIKRGYPKDLKQILKDNDASKRTFQLRKFISQVAQKILPVPHNNNTNYMQYVRQTMQ